MDQSGCCTFPISPQLVLRLTRLKAISLARIVAMEFPTYVELAQYPVSAQAQELGYSSGLAVPQSSSALLTAVGYGLFFHSMMEYEGMEDWKRDACKHVPALSSLLESVKLQYQSHPDIDVLTSEFWVKLTALMNLHADEIAHKQLNAYRADQRNSWPLLLHLSLDLSLSPVLLRRSTAGEFIAHRLAPQKKGMVVVLAEEADCVVYLLHSQIMTRSAGEGKCGFPYITDEDIPVLDLFRVCDPPVAHPESSYSLLKTAFSVLQSLQTHIEDISQAQALKSACDFFISTSLSPVPEQILHFATTASNHDFTACPRFDQGERLILPCGHKFHTTCWEKSGQTACPLHSPCSHCHNSTLKQNLLLHICRTAVCIQCLQGAVCPACQQVLTEAEVKWVRRRLG